MCSMLEQPTQLMNFELGQYKIARMCFQKLYCNFISILNCVSSLQNAMEPQREQSFRVENSLCVWILEAKNLQQKKK